MFECHITFRGDQSDDVQLIAESMGWLDDGWKFSAMEGDPELGSVKFCYLTLHDVDYDAIRTDMHEIIYQFRIEAETYPLRAKIEKIVYDERFS